MGEVRSLAVAGQYLTFMLKGQRFGVPIGSVREINRVCEITPLPQTPAYLVGVINLRGKVIPVVDLRLKLGIEKTEYTRETCIIVIESQFGQTGMIVDAVSEVVDLDQKQIEMPPTIAAKDQTFVMGMGKVEDGIIVLVDVLHTLSKDEVMALPNFEEQSAKKAA